MSKAARWGAVLFFALITLAPRATGATPRAPLQIQLVLAPCVPVEPAEVRRLLRIELDAELLPEATADGEVPRAEVVCVDAAVRIHIEDPITGKSLERKLELGAAATKARSRLLALALAELFLASWAELSLEKVPEAAQLLELPLAPLQVPLKRMPPQPRLAASELVRKHSQNPESAPLQLGIYGSFLSFPAYGATALFGGTLRLAGDVRYRLHWQVDAQSQYGTYELATGVLSATLFAVAVALHYQHRIGAWRLHAGGGARLGAAWLRGQPKAASQVRGLDLWGPFAGPMLRFGSARRLPRRLLLAGELEVGYAAVAVRGNSDGVRALAIEGPWVGILLGIGRIF